VGRFWFWSNKASQVWRGGVAFQQKVRQAGGATLQNRALTPSPEMDCDILSLSLALCDNQPPLLVSPGKQSRGSEARCADAEAPPGDGTSARKASVRLLRAAALSPL
jgi:hypothetical protein